jgi:hypothetical protein
LADRVNGQQGSKLAGHAHAMVASGEALTLQVRFSAEPLKDPFTDFEKILACRMGALPNSGAEEGPRR